MQAASMENVPWKNNALMHGKRSIMEMNMQKIKLFFTVEDSENGKHIERLEKRMRGVGGLICYKHDYRK